MTDTVTITRRDAHAIQSLLDHLNEWIESLVEGHSVPGKPLESDEAFRLSRDLRVRRRSEQLLIALDTALEQAS